jgi:GNAT superfamily N-acetyltransferase
VAPRPEPPAGRTPSARPPARRARTRTVALRDGASIQIRPIRPEDREGLAAGFARLSAESRYRRFFTGTAQLTDRDLDYLVHVDHRDHEALLAIDPASRDGVGVARYVRTGPDTAEPAVVVADDWQGRGVGEALLRRLVERARAEGIRRFEAPVLAGNTDAIRAFERLGGIVVASERGEVTLLIELPDRRPHRQWQRLLPHFAAGVLEPRTLLARLRPRSAKLDRDD